MEQEDTKNQLTVAEQKCDQNLKPAVRRFTPSAQRVFRIIQQTPPQSQTASQLVRIFPYMYEGICVSNVPLNHSGDSQNKWPQPLRVAVDEILNETLKDNAKQYLANQLPNSATFREKFSKTFLDSPTEANAQSEQPTRPFYQNSERSLKKWDALYRAAWSKAALRCINNAIKSDPRQSTLSQKDWGVLLALVPSRDQKLVRKAAEMCGHADLSMGTPPCDYTPATCEPSGPAR